MNEDKKTPPITKKIIVFYHDDLDGFTGAWAAWKKFKDKAEYVPVKSWSDEAPLHHENKQIYFIDFSFYLEKMKKLAEKNKVILIDHHLSSKETADSLPNSFHDTNRAGATLSWIYFHSDKKIPRLALHVEDMDIWKFKLPFTKEITAALELYDFDFKIWDKLAIILESKGKKGAFAIVKEGKTILKYQNTLIDKVIKNGQEVIFEGHESFAVNSPVLISEIGHKIYDSMGKLAIVWSHGGKKNNETIKVSLRSDKKINVAELAEKHGGGGHKGASSFRVDGKINFPWKIK